MELNFILNFETLEINQAYVDSEGMFLQVTGLSYPSFIQHVFYTYLQTKQGELTKHQTSLAGLSVKSNEINDAATKASFQSEVDAVSIKLKTAESVVGDHHKKVNDRLHSTPPQDFLDKIKKISELVTGIFPHVSKEFKYDNIEIMEKFVVDLKVRT